jgi:ferredoxin-NADP reductase
VSAVVPEARGVVSIYFTGNALDELPVAAGQFFYIRFLRRGGWWRPHPFSLSAAPDGQCLRMTIKDLGDDTHRMMTMPLGTPVFIEGPYGAFTPRVVTRDHVVMLGGGVGVTPLRAIFEALPPGRCHITFLYREGDSADTIFREELLALASRHGATLRFLEGHRGSAQMPIDPLAPEWLYRHAPHITAADVLVCGSRSFTERVLASLRTLRVPDDHIHAERFGY